MYRILGCIGLLLILLASAQAAPVIELSAEDQQFGLKPYAEYLLDPTTQLSAEEFRRIAREEPQRLQQFTGKGSALHLGYTSDVLWFRALVRNTTERDQAVVFNVAYPHVNRVEMLQFRGEELLDREEGGDELSMERRHYGSRSIALPATLEAGAEYEFVFRVRTPGLMSLPVTLHTESSFFQHQHWTNLVLYGVFGLFIGFFIYHLLVFIDSREWVYLAFAASSLTRLLFDLYATGEGHFLTPDALYWNNVAFAYMSSLAAAAGLWFHAEFLNLRQHSRTGFYAIMGFALVFLLGAQYAYFVDFYFFLVIGMLQLALPIVLCVSTLPWVARGYRPAKIYFVGALLVLLSLFLSNLSLLGVLPTVPNLALYSALGFTLSFVVFSFGISSKIKEIRRHQQEALYEAEAARARDTAKSEFLAHMSHEIRTPLNGVLGMTELLASSKLGEEQRGWVRTIRSSGRNLLNIVNDILDYSRIEAGRLSVEKIPFDLHEVCRDLEYLFSQTGKPGVELSLSLDPTVPRWVVGDPARVRQVLLNLLGNAHKFTAEGEIRLSVEKSSKPDHCRISVNDTGIGISPAQQDRLFNSFDQTRDGVHRHYGGSGLGLAICKQLTELMGGRIGVVSEVGLGSSFWVELPLPEAGEGEALALLELEGSRHLQPAENSLHLLIAEDNKVNQMVVERMIRKLGHRCTLVDDGCAAVEAVQASHGDFDLVLMDCDMPGKDGYRATLEIREYEKTKGLPRLPIVALTAHAVEGLRDKSLEFGMDDHLSKPLVSEELQAVIEVRREEELAS